VWDPTGAQGPAKLVAPPRTAVQFSRSDGSYLLGTVLPVERGDDYEILIWQVAGSDVRLLRRIKDVKVFGSKGIPDPLDAAGNWLAAPWPLPDSRLWSLRAPATAEPILLRRGPAGFVDHVTVSPDGQWLATNHDLGLTMWPLARPQPAVIRLDVNSWATGLAFDPKGRFLVLFSTFGTVSVVPLQQPVPPPGHVAFKAGENLATLAVSPDGERFAVGDTSGKVWIGANDGLEPVLLGDRTNWGGNTCSATFSLDGRYLAFMTACAYPSSAVFRVWDFESNNEIGTLHLPGEEFRFGSRFSNDGRLLTSSTAGIVAWDVTTGRHELLVEGGVRDFTSSDDGRRILYTEEGEGGILQDPAGSPTFVDLDSGRSTRLTKHGSAITAVALDRDGAIAVTGDRNGIIRVGRVTGEEPRLLLGHETEILGTSFAIDPLGRWIASATDDQTVRLWPMPDLSKPPLHTLPHDELIAKLKTLTNLRVVRDPDSATGWKLTHDPFPGWAEVPEW
jgi:WD40 repeat protein